MTNLYEMGELGGMKRSELQKLAKRHGIKANMKTDELIKALAVVTDPDVTSQQGSLPSPPKEEIVTASSTDDQSEVEAPEADVKGRRGRGRKRKNQEEKVDDEVPPEAPGSQSRSDVGLNAEEEEIKVSSAAEDGDMSPAPKKTRAKGNGRGRGRGRQKKKRTDEPMEEKAALSPSAEPQPNMVVVTSPAASVRGSRSKQATPATIQCQEEPTTLLTPPNSGSRYTRKAARHSSQTHTPLVRPTPPPPPPATKTSEASLTTHKRSSRSASKTAATTETTTPENSSVAGTGRSAGKRSASGSGGPKTKRVRRGTFDKSPAKGTAVEGPTSNGSTLKDEIMAEIDRKVQLKRAKSCIPTRVQPARKTPSAKNWSKTHHGAFNKMESIDDYLERKKKRIETLSASKKKRVTRTANSVSKPPPLSFASPKPSKKPVTAASKSAKSVSFKVSKLKTPSKPTLPRGIAPAGSVGRRQATPGVRKSVSVLTPGVRKSVFVLTPGVRKSVGVVTPARERKSFGAVKTPSRKSVGGAVTPFKNAFDLQASLSKPLAYKPHAGKLKPFGETQHSKANVSQPSNIVHAKTLVKKPHLKGRDERRAVNARHRAQRRNDGFMAKRGLPGL